MEQITTNDQIPGPTSSQALRNQLDEDALFAARLAEQDDSDCNSDAALALILQRQFDLEYNGSLKQQEAKLNGNSKVGVSLDRFRRTDSLILPEMMFSRSSNECPNSLRYDDSLSDLEDSRNEDDCRLAWDVFEESELKQRSRMMGRSGFVMDVDGNMITKHDIPTTSRKNMCRLMELKTDIETGDAGATKDDFRLTNYVYNKLKVHSKKSSRRASQRLFDKKDRESNEISNEAFRMNEATRAIMDSFLFSSKIEELNGVIGHGKESTILHAIGLNEQGESGKEIAVKIFRNDTNVAFKTRDTYNKSKCPSYKFDKPRSKNDSLNKWAEKGFKNLKALSKAGIRCPEAILLKKHVMIMNFLGTNAIPSPQLRDANLGCDQLRASYEQVIEIMERMYNQCDLIHADLSEYNLLWHNGQVYVIDVSQSMDSTHPNANVYLYRDCKNILDFYRKSGLADIMNEKELFTLVCGKNLDDKDIELWSKIEDFPHNEKLMHKDDIDSQNSSFKPKSDSFLQMLASTINTKPS